MGRDYRTRHNGRMLRFALLILLAATCGPAAAWNAAGHRLAAWIAWQQLDEPARQKAAEILATHPDHARWSARGRADDAAAIFAEAATWPDDIRGDPRFEDDRGTLAGAPLPGFPDRKRHASWHYVDLDAQGRVRAGEIDIRIPELADAIRRAATPAAAAYALPWLLHLVADIHQPLHVGRFGDEGGNAVTVENPFNPRQPFPTLHTYWDDLPGPPWLRGRRLEAAGKDLLSRYPPPVRGDVAAWRTESHALLASAYPQELGSLLPIIGEHFHERALDIARRRVAAAGHRLGWLLADLLAPGVPRETRDGGAATGKAPSGAKSP
ncbi:MAG: S1/P1 nuclease [Betaproteobacteria bacterium]|nr:S1/P1 nuclease [Betaproteobacteria bacterium]